ncbi:MAG: nucleotidyl transferase AbiEii/AbiGii toxin family protein, partial [Bdellovibrionales bacterium]
MDPLSKPSLALAKKTLPQPLFEVLNYLADQDLKDCVLAGGTALSGFYTGHRRSDDIDLFVKDNFSFKVAKLAILNLKKIQVQFLKEVTSSYYYNANCSLKNHFFTIDIILDENLFRVGEFFKIKNGFQVSSLRTLLSMKSAALVSRASEKDLSDVHKLFEIFKELSIAEFLKLGSAIDAGVNAESMLAAIGGAVLREDACDFSLNSKTSKKIIFNEINEFQKIMIKSLQVYLQNAKAPALGELLY